MVGVGTPWGYPATSNRTSRNRRLQGAERPKHTINGYKERVPQRHSGKHPIIDKGIRPFAAGTAYLYLAYRLSRRSHGHGSVLCPWGAELALYHFSLWHIKAFALLISLLSSQDTTVRARLGEGPHPRGGGVAGPRSGANSVGRRLVAGGPTSSMKKKRKEKKTNKKSTK